MEIIANKTLEAIENHLSSDNGKRFKELEQQFLPTMHDAYKAAAPHTLRDHVGASILGDPCKRRVWLNFRGVGGAKISAKMMRLFNRGHLEEARFHAMLQASGIKTFWQNGEKQYGYKKGMFAGSIDGLALNVPECPNELVMLEFKTMNESRFKQFLIKGMDAFPTYYNQCLINMKCMNEMAKDQLESVVADTDVKPELVCTLFLAVNKNTDEIHAVLITKDDETAQKYIQNVAEVLDKELPPPLHDSPKYFDCKVCAYKKYCFEAEPLPKNCRFCSLHSFDNNCDTCLFDFKECTDKCFVPFASQIKCEVID